MGRTGGIRIVVGTCFILVVDCGDLDLFLFLYCWLAPVTVGPDDEEDGKICPYPLSRLLLGVSTTQVPPSCTSGGIITGEKNLGTGKLLEVEDVEKKPTGEEDLTLFVLVEFELVVGDLGGPKIGLELRVFCHL